MKKKPFALSARGKRALKNVKPTPDHEIDFSDIPESTDAELGQAKRVGRPPTGNAKRLIAIRLNPKLLAALRKMASRQSKPYQTLIHELLSKAVLKVST